MLTLKQIVEAIKILFVGVGTYVIAIVEVIISTFVMLFWYTLCVILAARHGDCGPLKKYVVRVGLSIVTVGLCFFLPIVTIGSISVAPVSIQFACVMLYTILVWATIRFLITTWTRFMRVDIHDFV